MLDALCIRSYSTKPTNHSHDYYQLVLPLRGVIVIKVGSFSGRVAAGECVVVRKHEAHLFNANPEALFVVADMSELPENINFFDGTVFTISKSLSCYLSFIEAQLQLQLNAELERSMYKTFYLLLAEQELLPKLDSRIVSAMRYIQENLQETLTINLLAKVACLSGTQLKFLFKKQTGLTINSYITKLRMEKAQAVLRHTDFTVQLVGEMVGYPELSAFSRKFTQYFGFPPTHFKK